MIKRLSLVTCILVLATAGFKPVYAQHDNSQLSQIYIEEIPSREGPSSAQ